MATDQATTQADAQPGALTIGPAIVSQYEGTGATTDFAFTVTRAGDATGAAAVDYFLWTGGSEHIADGADFTGPTAGTLSFGAGETSKVIHIGVVGDATPEWDEIFHVTLSNPRGASIVVDTVSAFIVNDDNSPGGVVGFATTAVSQPEGNGHPGRFDYVVQRTGDTTGFTTVAFQVSGVGANPASADDIVGGFQSGNLTFGPGETSQILTISSKNDAVAEPDETFQVTLSSVGGSQIGQATATGTILNDDSSPGTAILSVSGPGSLPEGNIGVTAFPFTVTRSGDLTGVSLVDYFVWSTQTDSQDFSGPTAGTVAFSAGQTSQTIHIGVAGDLTPEADETFHLTLSNPRGATIGTGDATATIVNDGDNASGGPPAVSISGPGALQEGNSGVTDFAFSVSRYGDIRGSSWVDYFAWSNAATPDDFSGATTGTVYFGPGETAHTVHIGVVGDTQVEPDEAFNVTLSNPRGALPGQATATAVIVNDDTTPTAPASVSISGAPDHPEGNSGTTPFEFTLARSGDLSGSSLLDWFVWGDANAQDFSGATAGTVYFAAGDTAATIVVNVAGDTTPEPNEAFHVTLSNPRGATIDTGTATGHILDDDGWVFGSG